MKIKRILAYRVELPLHETTYKWSGGKSVTVFDSTIVRVETDTGLVGHGEVEEVLFQHPAVAEAAVFGLPDTHWGERVSAAIVLRPEARVEPAELDAFCRGRLAGYKRPRDWHVVSEIPKNVSGKVLKRELRVRFGSGGEAPK